MYNQSDIHVNQGVSCMNERDVQVESRKVFFFMLLIFCLIGIGMHSFSYLLGIIVGYVVCYVNFILTIKSSEMILKTGQNVMFVVIMFIAKLLLMILGFAICIITNHAVNIFAVFFGYLITPITIHWLNYKCRKEEMR